MPRPPDLPSFLRASVDSLCVHASKPVYPPASHQRTQTRRPSRLYLDKSNYSRAGQKVWVRWSNQTNCTGLEACTMNESIEAYGKRQEGSSSKPRIAAQPSNGAAERKDNYPF